MVMAASATLNAQKCQSPQYASTTVSYTHLTLPTISSV